MEEYSFDMRSTKVRFFHRVHIDKINHYGKNEISKLLYTQNPKATLSLIRKGNAYYSCTVLLSSSIIGTNNVWENVTFVVPISDMGDADFLPEMEAKFLRRWILK